MCRACRIDKKRLANTSYENTRKGKIGMMADDNGSEIVNLNINDMLSKKSKASDQKSNDPYVTRVIDTEVLTKNSSSNKLENKGGKVYDKFWEFKPL